MLVWTGILVSGHLSDLAELFGSKRGWVITFQRVREAEASLQQQLAAARGPMADMAEQRGRDEQALASLNRDRDQLTAEIEQLEQRRAQFQEQLAAWCRDRLAGAEELSGVGS